MALKQRVAQLVLAGSLSLVVVALLAAKSQDKKDPAVSDAQQVAKRCNPVMVKRSKLKPKAIRVRQGERQRATPLIAFRIADSGEVIAAHVKRTSGIQDMDDSAIFFVQSRRYNSRPGCPVIDSEAAVIIDIR